MRPCGREAQIFTKGRTSHGGAPAKNDVAGRRISPRNRVHRCFFVRKGYLHDRICTCQCVGRWSISLYEEWLSMKKPIQTCTTILLAVACTLLLSMVSCSDGGSSSSNSDATTLSLAGTWYCDWNTSTYVFTDTEYSISITRNGATEVIEKGTYSLSSLVFTTNKTYPDVKKTDWSYTLKTDNGKTVFTYDMYLALTKQ